MIGSLLQRELIQKGDRPVFQRAYCPEDMSRLHYLTQEQVSVLDSAWAAIADEALRRTHDLCSRHEGIKPFRTYTMERPDFAQLQDTEASDSSFYHQRGLQQSSESAYNTAPVVPYDMTLGTMASFTENQMSGLSAASAQDPFGVMDGSSFNTQFPIYVWPPLDGTAYLDDPSTWTVPS